MKSERAKKAKPEVKEFMTMHGAFHPKSDVDRLYVKRSGGGRGLISIERCIRQQNNSLKVYMPNSKEKLMKGACKLGKLEAEEIIGNK